MFMLLHTYILMDVLRGVVKIFDIQRGLGKNYFSSEGGGRMILGFVL